MYRVAKDFCIAIGHRLFKHKGKCSNYHGHNLRITVCVESESLNPHTNMVIDFYELKSKCSEIINKYDHSTILNTNDEMVLTMDVMGMNLHTVEDVDPTSEVLAGMIFTELDNMQLSEYNDVRISYVRIWESDASFAEYSRE